MCPTNAFDEWRERLSDLSETEFLALPSGQRPLVLVHQFALDSMGDGVGSLFYNSPQNVGGVSQALEGLGELELAQKIRLISKILVPFFRHDAPNWQEMVADQCMQGSAAREVGELDKLLAQRWDALYEKIEQRARSNGLVK
jgi:hypothetical protein